MRRIFYVILGSIVCMKLNELEAENGVLAYSV